MNKEQKNYLLGQSVGLDEASAYLMEESKLFYARRKDDIADLLRLYSEELKKRADARYDHPKT